MVYAYNGGGNTFRNKMNPTSKRGLAVAARKARRKARKAARP